MTMAINPAPVTIAKAVLMVAMALFRFMEIPSIGAAVTAPRFAPQRLQYLSSIVYSVPQDGQYME